ncbi:MAG: hypothetical protein QM533_10420 [Cytophagales bacterium]|nr:hypothetical protein [Cytophagales bacterium]
MTSTEIESLLADLTRCASRDVPIDFSTDEIAKHYIAGLHGSDSDAVKKLAKRIKISLGQSVQLFTGQPGSGKSTELYRLKKILEDDLKDDIRVYFLDVKAWINLTEPLRLSGFLIGLMASWARQADTDVTRTWTKRFYDFLNHTNVIPKGFKLETPPVLGAKLALEFALETDNDFRSLLDIEVRKQGSRFIEQAHAFIKNFKKELCGDQRKCVLIMDSLEQVRGYGKNLDEVYRSLEELFIGERQALNLPDVHAVYSISPFLYVRNAQLPALYGAGVIVNMPSVHVVKKQSNVVMPDPDGLERMRKFMTVRFERWAEVFTEKQLDKLILGSGGDLRDFLRAVSHASLADTQTLPLPDKEIDEALSKIKPPYESIHSSHIEWLKSVESSHEATPSDTVSAVEMFQYLASKHILTYLNGETWYSVHPLLRDWVLAKSA